MRYTQQWLPIPIFIHYYQPLHTLILCQELHNGDPLTLFTTYIYVLLFYTARDRASETGFVPFSQIHPRTQ